ncbi:MAG: hypothetical protein WCG20_02050 [bacterium]
MKHIKSIAIIIGLGVVILGSVLLWKYRTETIPSVPETPQQNQSTTNPVTIDSLTSGQAITLPMTVTGMVVGNWFFEGSFPVFMKDINGNQIGVALAHSSQDWMTTNSIPFSVTLPVTNYQGAGTLVFTKDNPSGEPQFDASYSVPVVFQ